MSLDIVVRFGSVSAYKDTIKFAKLRHFWHLQKIFNVSSNKIIYLCRYMLNQANAAFHPLGVDK